MTLIWHGDEFKGKLRKEMADRIAVACEILQGRAKQLIKEPYPPASLPGQPPHSRRFVQGLLGSVFYAVDKVKLVGIVGTNMIHGLYLELGTHDKATGGWKMRPRPWLSVALNQLRQRILAIFTKPMPD